MFRELDYYKPGYRETVGRFERFYGAVSSGDTGRFIYRALLASDAALYEAIHPNRYDYENGLEIYADDLAAETEKAYAARRDVRDDMLPCISPILGIGDYSAFAAGEIVFAEDTSWSRPVLNRLEDWHTLGEPGSAPWYSRFLRLTGLLLNRVRPAGVPYMRGFFSPLDLAQALRGDAIYTDFYDSPDEVHALLGYCADITIRFAGDIRALVMRELGGTECGAWFFRDGVNMSEDIACMISPALYREFAAPYTQRVIDHFGRGFLHCHSRALYIVPELCRLKNVKNIWIASDPNQPEPIDTLASLIAQANNVCLSIDCRSFEDIRRNIETAKEGNIAFCTSVDSIDQANRQTDFIRHHAKH